MSIRGFLNSGIFALYALGFSVTAVTAVAYGRPWIGFMAGGVVGLGTAVIVNEVTPGFTMGQIFGGDSE